MVTVCRGERDQDDYQDRDPDPAEYDARGSQARARLVPAEFLIWLRARYPKTSASTAPIPASHSTASINDVMARPLTWLKAATGWPGGGGSAAAAAISSGVPSRSSTVRTAALSPAGVWRSASRRWSRIWRPVPLAGAPAAPMRRRPGGAGNHRPGGQWSRSSPCSPCVICPCGVTSASTAARNRAHSSLKSARARFPASVSR